MGCKTIRRKKKSRFPFLDQKKYWKTRLNQTTMSIISSSSFVNTSTPQFFPNSYPTRRIGVRISQGSQPTSIWKRPAANVPHTRIENSFWSSGVAAKLKPIPSAVFLYLRSLADENAQCWPSPKRIALEIGSSESSVRRSLKLLKKLGLIEISICHVEGTDENTTNLYTILPLSSFRFPRQNEQAAIQSDVANVTKVYSQGTPNKNQGSFKQKTYNNTSCAQTPLDVLLQPAPDEESVVALVEENNIQSNDPQSSDSSQKEIEELIQQVLQVGIKPESKARALVLNTPIEKLKLQLDCLPDRNAKDKAALFLAAVKGDFDAPRSFIKRMEMQQSQQQEREMRAQQEALAFKKREEKKLQEQKEEKQKLELDALWQSLDKPIQEEIQVESFRRVGEIGILRPQSVAVEVERRNILREKFNFDCSKPKPPQSDHLHAPISFTSPSTSRIEAVVWSRLAILDDVAIEDIDTLQDSVGAALDDEEWESVKASVIKRWTQQPPR
jgi:hypothetical protein